LIHSSSGMFVAPQARSVFVTSIRCSVREIAGWEWEVGLPDICVPAIVTDSNSPVSVFEVTDELDAAHATKRPLPNFIIP
jgi:hypothetical protein